MTQPSLESLVTPVGLSLETKFITGVNAVFACWLSVSTRHFSGIPLTTLEIKVKTLPRFNLQFDPKMLRFHRFAFVFSVSHPHYTDARHGCRNNGEEILEIHSMDRFTRVHWANSLANAIVQTLRGCDHVLQNRSAGLKGAAQLLVRQSAHKLQRLIWLMCTEIECFGQRLNQLLNSTTIQSFQSFVTYCVTEQYIRLVEAEVDYSLKGKRDYDPAIPEIDNDLNHHTKSFIFSYGMPFHLNQDNRISLCLLTMENKL